MLFTEEQVQIIGYLIIEVVFYSLNDSDFTRFVTGLFILISNFYICFNVKRELKKTIHCQIAIWITENINSDFTFKRWIACKLLSK